MALLLRHLRIFSRKSPRGKTEDLRQLPFLDAAPFLPRVSGPGGIRTLDPLVKSQTLFLGISPLNNNGCKILPS